MSGGLKDVKLLSKEELEKLKLPKEMISYLVSSSHYEKKLYESILKDIEDLYLRYKAIYNFSTVEFCVEAIEALDRANSVDKFYYYLKKIIEVKIEMEPRQDETKYLQVDRSWLEEHTETVKLRYIDMVDKMFKKEEVDFYEVGRSFAEVEFALKLQHNDYLAKLLGSGKSIMDYYRQELNDIGE